jgi:hypothetical protein
MATMTTFSIERLFERLMVGTSAFVLLGAAAVLDDRVRDRATGVFAGTAMSELAGARDQVARAFHEASSMVGYQSNENGMLMFFVVAGGALFILAFRT